MAATAPAMGAALCPQGGYPSANASILRIHQRNAFYQQMNFGWLRFAKSLAAAPTYTELEQTVNNKLS
jgi:hypothetical protein